MDYLARMPAEIAQPVFDEILTGHYRRADEYYCWRSAGIAAWSIIYTMSGEGHFRVLSQETPVKQGQVVLLPPHAPHDYRTAPDRRWEILWAVFEPPRRWSKLLAWPKDEHGLFRTQLFPQSRPEVEERLLAMHRLALNARPTAAELAMNALEGALLLIHAIHQQSEDRAALDPAVIKVMEYISENLDQPLPLTELAHASGQSLSRMCHIFKRDLKLSPQAYVEKQRLARACHLLNRTTLSVKEIAEELAYSSQFYFTRRFTHYMGMSPTTYRASVWPAEQIVIT